MKNSILLVLFTCIIISANAQENTDRTSIFKTHQGFYLSASIGPVFGSINDELSGSQNMSLKFSGTGALMDLKIGLSLKNNTILHAALISSGIAGPTIQVDNQPAVKSNNDVGFGEAMLGVGVTKYIMPENIFFAGTIGFGNFTFLNDADNASSISSKRGLAFQVKIGKEWLLAPAWGLGVAATYGRTNVNMNVNYGDSEHISSNRFGIVLNATFNQVN